MFYLGDSPVEAQAEGYELVPLFKPKIEADKMVVDDKRGIVFENAGHPILVKASFIPYVAKLKQELEDLKTQLAAKTAFKSFVSIRVSKPHKRKKGEYIYFLRSGKYGDELAIDLGSPEIGEGNALVSIYQTANRNGSSIKVKSFTVKGDLTLGGNVALKEIKYTDLDNGEVLRFFALGKQWLGLNAPK